MRFIVQLRRDGVWCNMGTFSLAADAYHAAWMLSGRVRSVRA